MAATASTSESAIGDANERDRRDDRRHPQRHFRQRIRRGSSWTERSPGAFRVQGNFIGTDSTGTLASAERRERRYGQRRHRASRSAGPSAGAGNLISGNGGIGVVIAGGSGHFVQGNCIGTDVTGTRRWVTATAWPSVAPSNTIGGTAAGAAT